VIGRTRLLERLGRAFGFSPEGRSVRVWVRSRPGEEDAVVLGGTVVEVTPSGALIQLDEAVHSSGRELARVLAVPSERGFGLDALWFAFIPVQVFPAHAEGAEPIGRWWIRLGRPG
jgi:hypothetical protein